MEKISLVLFLSALITMVLGLILIGTVKEGFLTLKFLCVGEVLQFENKGFSTISHLGQLKFGTVLAAIITPILFGLSVVTFGYHIYKIKIREIK